MSNAQVIPDIRVQVNKHAWEILMGMGNREQEWGIQIDPEQIRGHGNAEFIPDIQAQVNKHAWEILIQFYDTRF